MTAFSLQERAEFYRQAFPDYPPLAVWGRWLYGVWEIGNNYRGRSGYYGEYPPGYLKRVRALFPEADKVLHLCAGRVASGYWPTEVKLDIRADVRPDVAGDSSRLPFKSGVFDLVLCDPPYTRADAQKYRTGTVNRRLTVKEASRVLRATGHLVWLDTQRPMFRKEQWKLVGAIALVRSTNHRVRLISIFENRYGLNT